MNYFKKILNSFLGKELSLPLGKGNYLQLNDITQVLKGTINNVPLEIIVTPEDFLDRRPGAPSPDQQNIPGSVADDFGDGYLKVVTHKFIRAYNQKVDAYLNSNPLPEGTRFSTISSDIIFNEGTSPAVSRISNQKYEVFSISGKDTKVSFPEGQIIEDI